MTDAFDSGNEKLAVTHDRITGGAYFYFRGKRFDLPGKYASQGEAQKAAEDRCRAMGWRG